MLALNLLFRGLTDLPRTSRILRINRGTGHLSYTTVNAMIQRSLTALLLLPVLASAAYAQYYDYGYYGRYGGRHASTAAEGYARGMADMIRSAGSYNLDTSRAAINVEQARREYLENRDLAQQIWFDMRRRNDAYREENRRPRITSEQLFRINAQRAPQRLSQDDYDPVTGELYWPYLLRAEVYEPFRVVVDQGYQTRSQAGSFRDHQSHQTVVEAVDVMYEELRKRIRDYEPQEYVDANRFMEKLTYDVRFPSG